MIQRIQSVFLFLMGALMTAVLFLPIWSKTGSDQQADLTALYLTHSRGAEVLLQNNTMYLAGLAFLSVILSFASLFSYKNRLAQMKLNMANTLVLIIFMGLTAWLSVFTGQQLFEPETGGQMGAAFFFAPLSMILSSLANRFIGRDERLVRSSYDRIR